MGIKISALTQLTQAAAGDMIPIVDTTAAPDETKRILVEDLVGIGATIPGGTTGSLLFIGASSVLAQDNANLFWDDTNNMLGVGTASPNLLAIADAARVVTLAGTTGASGVVLELGLLSDAIADNDIVGRVQFIAGSATKRRVAQVLARIDGTSEDAADVEVYTMTAGAEVLRATVHSDGDFSYGSTDLGRHFGVKASAATEAGGLALIGASSANPLVVLHETTDDGKLSIYSGTNKRILLDSTSSSYIATGGDTAFGIGTTTPDGVAGKGSNVRVQLAGNRPFVITDATATDCGFIWAEADDARYSFYYDLTNNYLALWSTNSDGAGADAEVIRIPDGQLTVDFNATADDNAFDYVCEACGWHDAADDNGGSCPKCAGKVEWHDDLDFLNAVVKTKGGLRNAPTDRRAKLERLGIMKVTREIHTRRTNPKRVPMREPETDEDPEEVPTHLVFDEEHIEQDDLWVNHNRLSLYLASALSQAHDRIRALERHVGLTPPRGANA